MVIKTELRRNCLYDTKNSYRRDFQSSDVCLVGCNRVYCGGWRETFGIYVWPPCPEGPCHHPENHILKTYILVSSSYYIEPNDWLFSEKWIGNKCIIVPIFTWWNRRELSLPNTCTHCQDARFLCRDLSQVPPDKTETIFGFFWLLFKFPFPYNAIAANIRLDKQWTCLSLYINDWN